MKTPLRILVVEDSPEDALLVVHRLREGGFDVAEERVDNPQAMKAALNRQPWDVVLADYAMPRFSAPAALRILHESELDLPFIVVSGSIGEEVAVACMKAGAHDYVMKDELARLVPAVRRELREAAERQSRRRAEEQVRRSSALLEIAGQIATFGGWSVDLADQRVSWSDQVARIHDEPPGHSPSVEEGISYYAPEWREKIITVFTACSQAGTPFDEEMQIITARGRRVWVRTVGIAVRDKAGRIVQVQGAFQDINERKTAELALRESEERLRRAIVESPMPVMIHAEDGSVLQLSRSWCEITGYQPEEIPTISSWTELAYGERKELVRGVIDTLYLQDHRSNEGDFAIRTKAGETRIWEFSSAPLGRMPDGRRLVISVALDVTERRRAEQALRDREEIFSSIVGQANDAIALIDGGSGRFLEFNAAAHLGLGYTREEFARLSLPELSPESSAAEFTANFARLVEEHGHGGAFETCHRHRCGELCHVRISARRLDLAGRNWISVIWNDITRAKKTESTLRQQTAELRAQNERLSIFHHAAVDRELRMIELKRELDALCHKLGEPCRYGYESSPAEEEKSRPVSV